MAPRDGRRGAGALPGPAQDGTFRAEGGGLFQRSTRSRTRSDLSERGRTFLNPNDPIHVRVAGSDHALSRHRGEPALSKEEKQRAKANEQANYDQASERIHNISAIAARLLRLRKGRAIRDREQGGHRGRVHGPHRCRAGAGATACTRRSRRRKACRSTARRRRWRRSRSRIISAFTRSCRGMTGTAETEANEFHDIYKLDVVVIPTNRPIARVDIDDIIYKTRREKYNAIVREITAAHAKGQPILGRHDFRGVERAAFAHVEARGDRPQRAEREIRCSRRRRSWRARASAAR